MNENNNMSVTGNNNNATQQTPAAPKEQVAINPTQAIQSNAIAPQATPVAPKEQVAINPTQTIQSSATAPQATPVDQPFNGNVTNQPMKPNPVNVTATSQPATSPMSPTQPEASQPPVTNQQEQILATTEEAKTDSITQNTTNEEIVQEKPKKKSKIPILLLLILLAGGLYLFYNYFLMNEERIIKSETKKVFAFITEKVNRLEKNTFDYDIEKEKIGLEGKLTISSNYKTEELDLAKLSNYNITYNGAIDKSNNKLSGSIALNKNNDKVLSSDMYMQGKDILIKLNELFDKALKTTSEKELKDIETTKSLSYANIKTILNKTEEITLNTIDKKELNKRLIQKEINNKKDYYMEIKYKLNLRKYTINLIDGYLEDEEIIKIFAETSNKTSDEIKTTLKDTKKSIEEASGEDTIIDLVFYMDKIMGSFKEVDIINQEKDNSKDGYIYKYIIYKNDNIYKFEYNANGKVEKTGTYDLEKKELTITSKDEYSSTNITLTETDDNTLNIILNISNKDSYNLTVSTKINNQISSTSQINNTTININYKYGEQKINAEINNNITITKGKEPVELKNNDYVEVESLTEEQINSMKQKASNIMESVLKDFIIDQTKVPDLNQTL